MQEVTEDEEAQTQHIVGAKFKTEFASVKLKHQASKQTNLPQIKESKAN